MQKLIFMLLLLSTVTLALNSQTDNRIAATTIPLEEVEQLQLPSVDNEELQQIEMARRGPGIAPRFAEVMEVDISPTTHGTWDYENGQAVWRLRVPSPGAKSINFGFDKYVMPLGGRLMLYTPDLSQVQGPFTPADNEEHEELWTPVIPGDEIVIEVSLPEASRNQLQLHLKSVNHDFLGFNEVAASIMSMSCNLDVVCGAADGWGIVDQYRDIIQSVAVFGTGGGTFCTGFLVNNAREDCTPFFMTANHCGVNQGNAASLVVYWNYVNSVCREPGSGASGGPGDGSLADFNTGAIFRASYSPSDMTLVELDDPVSETADAWFAGWDATDVLETDTLIGIHHPNTDEKRISFEFDGSYVGGWPGDTPVPGGNHLIVADWDIGTTEGGSSGSPLFNSDKRVIGQLHGGDASCDNDLYDSYGWFFTSWEGGGAPNSRLKDWLDPDNIGILQLDGRAQLQCSFAAQAQPATQSLCAPAVANYDISVNENFVGPVDLSLANFPAELTAVFDQQTVNPGETTQMSITGTENLAAGTYVFTLNGTDGTNVSTQTLVLHIFNGTPVAPTLLSPLNMATGQMTTLSLVWQAVDFANSYDIEVATDPAFTNVIAMGADIDNLDYLTPNLDILSTYYWRVRANNICGTGEWSDAFQYETSEINCGTIPADTDGLTIGPAAGTVTTSTLVIDQPGDITDISLTNLSMNHTWVGDLNATLTSPDGTTIVLFNRPDCDLTGMLVDFSDDAVATSMEFENTCSDTGIAIEGAFQPAEAFSIFEGESASGTWTLSILDNENQDGGDLQSWNLQICTAIPNTVTLAASEEEVNTCASETVVVELTVGTGFTNMVTLSADNLPPGAIADFEQNPVAPGATVSVTLSNLTASGVFALNFQADDGMESASAMVSLEVTMMVPAVPQLASPTDMATGQSTTVSLSWQVVDFADTYDVELATDPAFTNVVASATNLDALDYQTPLLDILSTYYWRVRAHNVCGSGEWSDTNEFLTAAILCGVVPAPTEGLTIGPAAGTVTTSSIMIGQTGEVVDVNLTNLFTNHTYVGDLNATLTSPAGTTIILFNRPACDQGGLQVSFSDDAEATAFDFQNTCSDTGIAIEGEFQPAEAFSAFAGESAEGEWTLAILDNANVDGGDLMSWNLEICTLTPFDVSISTAQPELTTCLANGGEFVLLLGADFGDELSVDIASNDGQFDGFTQSFDTDSRELTLSWEDFTGNQTGSYNLVITVTGEGLSNSIQTTVVLLSAPDLSGLQQPANEADVMGGGTVNFDWAVVDNADGYLLEVATDDTFTDIVLSEELVSPGYAGNIEVGQYYWRVTTINDCGESTSGFFVFTVIPTNATVEIEGVSLNVWPNPTNGPLQITLSDDLSGTLEIVVLTIRGRQVRNLQLPARAGTHQIDLNDLPAGPYLVRLTNGLAQKTVRIIVQ